MKTDPIEEAVNLVLANRLQCKDAGAPAATAQAVGKSGPVILLREPYPGDSTREIILLKATFAPGDSTPPHHHPGVLVGYVLTGELEFQLEGGPLQRLIAGDRFYEPPESTHIVSRNPGETTTEVLAFVVRETGAPVMIPLQRPGSEGSRPGG
jgi:quercetin dioxygenase-like cupin family protein